MKTFHAKLALTHHVAVGTHFFKPTTESKLDTIARDWALNVADVATISQELSLPASERFCGMDDCIVGAWAIMSTKRRKRFSADMKQFMLLEFYSGSAIHRCSKGSAIHRCSNDSVTYRCSGSASYRSLMAALVSAALMAA